VAAISLQALNRQVRRAFPVTPKPRLTLLPDFRSGDIYESILKRFDDKVWTEIRLDDWINTATVAALVHAFSALSFHYYVPSLLIGAASNINYLDWGLHALLPQNKSHVPRGEWWLSYRRCFSEVQVRTARQFIAFSAERAVPDGADAHLAGLAHELWRTD
jgi:hypothetical protein